MEIFEDDDIAVFDLTGRENVSLPLQGHTTTLSSYIHSKLTVFQATQSTFRSLEMHSKKHYKICRCSVNIGQLEFSRNCMFFSRK